MFRVRSPRLDSGAGETLSAFKRRLAEHLDRLKAKELDKLTERYKRKEAMIRKQLDRARTKVAKEEADVTAKTTDTLVDAGLAVLGAFFGSRSTRRFGSTVSKGARIAKEKQDVRQAEEALAELERRYDLLKSDFEQKIDMLDAKFSVENYRVEPYKIRPKMRDISIEEMVLLWR
jgi:DNA-binding ferritin-like protein